MTNGRADLPVRHDAARRRADPGRRFLGRRQASPSRGHWTARASTISKAAGPAPIRPTTPSSPNRRHSKTPRFTAFGMTRRPGRSAANDPASPALLGAECDAVCMVGKTWDFHVDVALNIPRDEKSELIRDSIAPDRRAQGRGAVRRRAFLRRLQGQSRIRDAVPAGRL